MWRQAGKSKATITYLNKWIIKKGLPGLLKKSKEIENCSYNCSVRTIEALSAPS